MSDTTNAQKAAELASIPLEHFLCAQSIYHTLALMNPEDVLRPSHYGMLVESVESLKPIVIGPDEEEKPNAAIDDEIERREDNPEPTPISNTTGTGFLQFIQRLGTRGTPGA